MTPLSGELGWARIMIKCRVRTPDRFQALALPVIAGSVDLAPQQRRAGGPTSLFILENHRCR
jgi:hypothetical protein